MEQDTQQGASANLQALLDRIRKEGVDKAEAEAKAIVERATNKADELVGQAEARAEAIVKDASDEAEKTRTQSQRALEQAARNVVLAVGAAVQTTLDRLLKADIGEALTGEALQALIAQVVEAYAAKLPAGAAIEVLVPESGHEAIARAIIARLGDAARKGLDVRADGGVVSGFRVTVKGSSVEHDFTADAIAEALARLVRPQLAERIRAAQAAADRPPA